jgi:Fe-coproporphyrin III synthase
MTLASDPIWSPLPHKPGVLLIHLLDQCNLLCQHCYMDASPKRHTRLPLELALSSLKDVEKLGIETIYLSGGEPFLYPQLPEVLATAAQQSRLNVYIATNGTLIGPDEAELLKGYGVNVQVSIDGPQAFHDSFRGVKGAFSRASRGIEALVEAGVPVTIVVTICRNNRKVLPWLSSWAEKMGVDQISVSPLLQLGRGAKIHYKKLSEEELSDLFLQLSDLGNIYRSRGLRFSLACRTRHFLLAHPCAAYVCNGLNCHRKVVKEIKKLVIRENGTVLPEIPTLDDRFALGKLQDGTLAELVTRYFEDGYAKFDLLCRTIYDEILPNWTSPIVPWDEIISERSVDFD